MEIFAFCVIIHEPIKIQTCSAPQNDRLNFVFMKDIYVDSEKVARNSSKTAIQLSQILGTTLYIMYSTLLNNCTSRAIFFNFFCLGMHFFHSYLQESSRYCSDIPRNFQVGTLIRIGTLMPKCRVGTSLVVQSREVCQEFKKNHGGIANLNG